MLVFCKHIDRKREQICKNECSRSITTSTSFRGWAGFVLSEFGATGNGIRVLITHVKQASRNTMIQNRQQTEISAIKKLIRKTLQTASGSGL